MYACFWAVIEIDKQLASSIIAVDNLCSFILFAGEKQCNFVGFGRVGQKTNLFSRVSQRDQKSEFWYVTYPTGSHRLDEPPEQFSA